MKRLLSHPAIQDNGFIKSGKTLFRAGVIPLLLYSCECWFGMSDGMFEVIEAKYRKLLYTMLHIPKHTKYDAVIHELKIKKARHIIESQQMCFINTIVNNDDNEEAKYLLDKEVSDRGDGTSVKELVEEMCSKYQIPSIFEFDVDNETIKFKVKRFAEVESWKSCLSSRLVVSRPFIRLRIRPYYRFNKAEGRAILLWRCGYLKFRDSWRDYHSKRDGLKCPNSVCPETDNLDHAFKCKFSVIKMQSADTGIPFEKRMARFLLDLNADRLKIKLPIL